MLFYFPENHAIATHSEIMNSKAAWYKKNKNWLRNTRQHLQLSLSCAFKILIWHFKPRSKCRHYWFVWVFFHPSRPCQLSGCQRAKTSEPSSSSAAVWTPADMNKSLAGSVGLHFYKAASDNKKTTVDRWSYTDEEVVFSWRDMSWVIVIELLCQHADAGCFAESRSCHIKENY